MGRGRRAVAPHTPGCPKRRRCEAVARGWRGGGCGMGRHRRSGGWWPVLAVTLDIALCQRPSRGCRLRQSPRRPLLRASSSVADVSDRCFRSPLQCSECRTSWCPSDGAAARWPPRLQETAAAALARPRLLGGYAVGVMDKVCGRGGAHAGDGVGGEAATPRGYPRERRRPLRLCGGGRGVLASLAEGGRPGESGGRNALRGSKNGACAWCGLSCCLSCFLFLRGVFSSQPFGVARSEAVHRALRAFSCGWARRLKWCRR